MWIVDFAEMSLEEATQYEMPIKHIEAHVRSSRLTNNESRQQRYWWQFARPRPEMREAIIGMDRFIVTTRVAKYRLFVFLKHNVVPDSRLCVIARDDDYFFGVLHSKIHEVWSLRQVSWHGDGTDSGRPTYKNTECFETFPFPWPPGSEDTSHPAHAAISRAAKQLHEERHAWLNPNKQAHPDSQSSPSLFMGEGAGGWGEKALKDRTLTNLYNALQVWRGLDSMKTKAAASDFAPRLDELHRALDHAVCDAYGWEHNILEDEEEILHRLLALNLGRAGSNPR